MNNFTRKNSFFRHLAAIQQTHQRSNQMLAQSFQFVVDRSKLRIAACGQKGIVVADDGKLLRYAQSCGTRIFDSAESQIVIRGNDTPKQDALSLKLHQITASQ